LANPQSWSKTVKEFGRYVDYRKQSLTPNSFINSSAFSIESLVDSKFKARATKTEGSTTILIHDVVETYYNHIPLAVTHL
jgi:hypothetical protein